MKPIRAILLSFMLLNAEASWALCSTNGEFAAGDALIDLFIFRPIGIVGTLLGAGAFLVSTPFMAIASIAPPHDAVQRTADTVVVPPARWTFLRPFGDCAEMGYEDSW